MNSKFFPRLHFWREDQESSALITHQVNHDESCPRRFAVVWYASNDDQPPLTRKLNNRVGSFRASSHNRQRPAFQIVVQSFSSYLLNIINRVGPSVLDAL